MSDQPDHFDEFAAAMTALRGAAQAQTAAFAALGRAIGETVQRIADVLVEEAA